MSEGKWTRGPWEYRELAPHNDGLGYISADGHDIIHAGVSDLPAEENRANARLIAASPTIAEAAESVLDYATLAEILADETRDDNSVFGIRLGDLRALSAALALASGDQS